MSAVLEGLKRAKEKIENPENWMKGYSAKDKDGNLVEYSSSSACRFCASGALLNAFYSEGGYSRGCSELMGAARELNHHWIPYQ